METDDFLAELDVHPNSNIDELSNQIARVLSWMQFDPYSEPDASKVKVLLRAALFLYGNLQIHGQALEQKLQECRLIPKNELNPLLEKFHAGTLLSDVCERLLMTVTGPDHILAIQDFFLDFLDTQQYTQVLSKVREQRRSELIEDRVEREAKFLIFTTFELGSAEDIEVAIGRIVDNVNFDVLAWIVNVRVNDSLNYFAMKCLIIQRELCSRLESGSVSGKFITSMYETCTLDEDGLRTYFKCLQNNMFATSLMEFFLKYLNAVNTSNHNADQNNLKQHDLGHVSFLIAGMMSKKSDCRIEFYKKLAAMSVSVDVLMSISHLNFVYDF